MQLEGMWAFLCKDLKSNSETPLSVPLNVMLAHVFFCLAEVKIAARSKLKGNVQ